MVICSGERVVGRRRLDFAMRLFQSLDIGDGTEGLWGAFLCQVDAAISQRHPTVKLAWEGLFAGASSDRRDVPDGHSGGAGDVGPGFGLKLQVARGATSARGGW